jgi:23S rRNA (cytidine1920-2'-O)/16S rRNA (cytidine1409-2'-O)-methyltransferase
MRLDKYLLTEGFFSTRQKAKEAIKMGHVLIDGKIAMKPSMEVSVSAEVTVISDEMPKGYWKLRKIDDTVNL